MFCNHCEVAVIKMVQSFYLFIYIIKKDIFFYMEITEVNTDSPRKILYTMHTIFSSYTLGHLEYISCC